MSRAGFSRRRAVGASLALACASSLVLGASPAKAIPVEVCKDAGCGCCKEWVAHMEANGFKVKVNDGGNDAARARLGVGMKHGSCHTALVGGYALEGHVPAREVKRLLAEKPFAIGLAVPGLPVGSPGMDGAAYGGRKDAFEVLLLAKDGSSKVYQRYEGNRK